jgi:hypothetical protein
VPLDRDQLPLFGSALMPDDDVSDSGGVIDEQRLVSFLDVSAVGLLDVSSTDAADDPINVSVSGLDETGAPASDVIVLAGLSLVVGAQRFSRVDKIVVGSTTAGSVTVRRYPGVETLVVLPPAATEARKPFYAAVSSPTARKVFYEKVFFKNASSPPVDMDAPSVTLTSGEIAYRGTAFAGSVDYVDLTDDASVVDDYYADMVAYVADGAGAGQYRLIGSYVGATKRAYVVDPWITALDDTSVVEMHALLVNLDDAVNDTTVVTDRLTEPTGLAVAGWVPAAVATVVPGGALDAGDRIGVWLRLVRPAGGVASAPRTFSLALQGREAA